MFYRILRKWVISYFETPYFGSDPTEAPRVSTQRSLLCVCSERDGVRRRDSEFPRRVILWTQSQKGTTDRHSLFGLNTLNKTYTDKTKWSESVHHFHFGSYVTRLHNWSRVSWTRCPYIYSFIDGCSVPLSGPYVGKESGESSLVTTVVELKCENWRP